MQNNMFKEKMSYIAKGIYILSFLFILIAPVLSLNKLEIQANIIFGLGWGLSIVAIVLLLISNKITEISKKTKGQLLIIYLMGNIFWNIAIFSLYENIISTNKMLVIIVTFSINIGFIFWLISYYRKLSLVEIKDWFKQNYWLLIINIIFILLCVETLNNWIKLDSVSYYKYFVKMKSWDFTTNNIELFKLAGHNAYSYALLGMIGELLIPDNGVGVRIINFILIGISIYLFSKILEKLIPTISKKENVLCTILLAISPLILGTVTEINLEVGVFFFFICVVHSYYYENKILMLFFSICLVFTKENSSALYLGFLFGIIILEKLRLKKVYIKKISIFLLPILILAIVLKSGTLWMLQPTGQNNTGGFNRIGVHSIVIINRLKQMFFLNYTWVYILIILLIFVNKILYVKLNNFKKFYVFIPLFFAYLSFMTYQLFYITYVLTRYIMLNSFFILIGLAFFINKFKIEKLKIIIYISLIILTFIENFFTIDKVTLALFPNINIGTTNIITTQAIRRNIEDNSIITDNRIREQYLTTSAIYNRQYSYLDDLIEKALSNINYKDTDLVIIPAIYGERTQDALIGSNNNELYFDIQSGNMLQVFEGQKKSYNEFEKFNYIILDNLNELPNLNDYDKIYYFKFDYNNYNDNNFIAALNLKFKETITYKGWSLKLYAKE